MNLHGAKVSEIAAELMVFPRCVIDVLQGKDVYADKAVIHTWDVDDYMNTINVGDEVIVYAQRFDAFTTGLNPDERRMVATVRRKYPNIVDTTEGAFQNKEIYQWNHNRGKFSELHSDRV